MKRGRPSSDQHEDLDAQVAVRMTSVEKARLVEMCDSEGVTLSAFVRAKTFGRVLTSKSDATLIRELRRQGGLLKHLATLGALDFAKVNEMREQIDFTIRSIRGIK